MAKKIMYKLNLILLFGLCSGFSSTLYSAQPNGPLDVDDQKESIGHIGEKAVLEHPSMPPYGTLPMTTYPVIHPYPIPGSSMPLTPWQCTSVQDCSACDTIITCLKHWQLLNLLQKPENILCFLSAENNYLNIVSAYHHLLDKHLCNNSKKALKYISNSAKKVGCRFKKCRCYKRNQRTRAQDKEKNKAHRADNNTFIFLRDLLDTIHVHLVHSGDTGHIYLKPYTHPTKDDQKQEVFDLQLKKLAAWQAPMKKRLQDQHKRDKFQTKVYEVRQGDEHHISLALLKERFSKNNTFKAWIQYLEMHECDTDNIVEAVLSGQQETLISIDDDIFAVIKDCIKEQQTDKHTFTGRYPFGIRLYYWQYYQSSDQEAPYIGTNYGPIYRQKDLYVGQRYLCFKNEILAKSIPVHSWNQKMWEAQMLLSQSSTLRKLKAEGYDICAAYGIAKHSRLEVYHLVAVIFYTNFPRLCDQFNDSFRFLYASESLESLKKRNSRWFFLSRYLREVVEVFGERIGYDAKAIYHDKGVFYHGASCRLLQQPSVYFYGPLSTSQQLAVPMLFTDDKGVILALKYDHRSLKLFNTCFVSRFAQEDERLFMGGQFPLRISNIRRLQDYIYMQPIMHLLFVMDKMIQGTYLDGKVIHKDITLFKQLVYSPQDTPLYVRQLWKNFTHKQQILKINMLEMDRCYKLFVPKLFSASPKLKHLLLFDKMVRIFPNVTQIICHKVDCIGWHTTKGWHSYYTDIINPSFIWALKGMISNITHCQASKLEKIIIQLVGNEQQKQCNVYGTQFDQLGWQLQKKKSIIVLTKKTDALICKGVIDKISLMIAGKVLGYDKVTSCDISILKKLLSPLGNLPLGVKATWVRFKNKQQNLKFDMYYIYRYYALFMPLLFSSESQCKNLLLVDKIARIFPNVTEIVCERTDYSAVYNEVTKSYCSSAIVRGHFLDRLKAMLPYMAHNGYCKLKKIIIKTWQYEIKEDCMSYAKQFAALGWGIKKEKDVTNESWRYLYNKYSMIVLTKLSA